jgi:superfamily II DNA or RNA helicase
MTIQTACRAYNEPIDQEIKKYDDLDEDDINMIKSEDFSHLKTKREDIKKLIENTQGVYFDEVQHCPATTCQKTIEKSTNAYYLFGGSATPYRADNATIVIEGLFGRKRAEIDASRLIKEGYLESPQIFYIKLKEPNKRVNNYEEDYKSHIVNNEERNKHIIKICEQLKEKKIPTMVIVQRIEHGEFLQSQINGSRFIQGASSKKTRQKALYDLDNGLLPVLLATSLADEGLDLPCLSALVIASGGKSITKVKQRVGRVIRKHPNKKCALVFDFLDVGRWVSRHARKRRQILKSEKQFRIYETENFILTEKTIKKELF